MSQLSSTLKRYVDSSRYAENTYSKMPGGYSSYTSYGSTYTYADRDKIGFKSSYLPSPRYHHSRLSPTMGYDSGRLPLYPDSSIRLSPTYIRTHPPGVGLSGGSCYSYTGTPSSPTSYVSTSTLLSRRRAVSHSDLAQEFSGLHTSDSGYASSPSALHQAATSSEYVRDYLEKKSSHCSLPSSSQLWEGDDSYGPDPTGQEARASHRITGSSAQPHPEQLMALALGQSQPCLPLQCQLMAEGHRCRGDN
ncbi:UNVERIFIED_CONTAM: hypothetical protein H355_014348 [Colinus virginianus]|nr:hypothetical protein H355_014348 [Colinus virginianus]